MTETPFRRGLGGKVRAKIPSDVTRRTDEGAVEFLVDDVLVRRRQDGVIEVLLRLPVEWRDPAVLVGVAPAAHLEVLVSAAMAGLLGVYAPLDMELGAVGAFEMECGVEATQGIEAGVEAAGGLEAGVEGAGEIDVWVQ